MSKKQPSAGGVQRAYCMLEIKAVDDTPGANGKRTFTGIATTPTPDRYGDIVEPTGAQFKLPIPLLWQHNSNDPIGWVTEAKVTDKGIEIVGEVANLPAEDAGSAELAQRLSRAWAMLKGKLVQALSIGFTSIEHTQIDNTWSYRFLKWEWLELSAVTIPANADCSINTIKSFDRLALRRAALGKSAGGASGEGRDTRPGVSGKTKATTNPIPKGTPTMDIKAKIDKMKAERDALMKRAGELIEKKLAQTDDDPFTSEEQQEQTDATAEVKRIDATIRELEEHQKLMGSTATEMKQTTTVDDGAAVRVPGNVISAKRNLAKGTSFTRFAMALAHSKGNLSMAAKVAQQWKSTTPEVAQILSMAENFGHTDFAKAKYEMFQRAASDFGTTTDTTFAAPLVYYENMASEFIDLLRPATILGRLQGLRRVPFNIRMAGKTQGSTVGWVGEGAPKPVGELGFNEVRLGHAKAAGIIVLSMELARFSSPAAEQLVRDDLIDAIAQFLDQQFIDPAVAAVANVSPASILNGLTAIPSSGITIAAITNDVKSLFTAMLGTELDPSKGVWIMKPGTALALGMIRTSQDQFAFPDITITGGEFFGLPVVVSNSVPGSVSGGSLIALVIQNEVFLADDGGVTIDVSQEASVQMNTTPSAGAQSLVSLWQNNLIGVRAEREINWQRRRDAAVGYIDGFGH